MTLLERAKTKYENSKNVEISYNGKTFGEFLLECYLNYTPACYGKYIQKKFESEMSDKDIFLIRNEEKNNCGDLRFEFPNPYYCSFKHPNELYYELDIPFEEKPVTKNWEFKVSYLGKNSTYTVRNLRPYQKLNGGYILCFIDCENDFKEEFYLVDYKVFEWNFTLTHMNGTKDKHTKDSFENYGFAFRKNSTQHRVLKKYNNLNGTELSDLVTYFQNVKNELRNEFWNLEGPKEYIKEMMGRSTNVSVKFKSEFLNQDNFKETVDILIEQIKSEYDRVLGIKITGYDFNTYQLLFEVKDKISGWDYVDAITEKYDKYFSRVFKSNPSI